MLSVTFSPKAIGTRTANIAIVVTGITNPAPITLTGTGTAPDLAITKSHAGSFEVGVNNTYAIKLTNNGTAPTQQPITVIDTLPAGLSFVSGAPASWTCNAGAQNAQVVTCTNAGPIAVSASSTLTLTVSVASAAFPAVTNSATVADAGDSGTNDKTATDSVTTVTAPDVTVALTHPASPDFVVASNGTYTIKVTNNGSGPTTGTITVTDTLPAGLSFASNSGAGWGCAANAQNAQSVLCIYNGAPLAAAGGNSSFTLTVSVAPGAFPSVTNAATVADPNDGRSTDKSVTDVPTNIDNAVPTASAVTPNTGMLVGTGVTAQQIVLTGTGYNSSTQVTLGSTTPLNTPLTGTANAAGTSLTITLPVADLSNPGTLTIAVINPKNPNSNAGGGTAPTTLPFPLVAMETLTPQSGTPSPVPVVAGTPFILQMNLVLSSPTTPLPADVTVTCSFPMALTGATCTPNPSKITQGTTSPSTTITINAVPTKSGNSGLTPSAPRTGGQGPLSTYTLYLIAMILLVMLGSLAVIRQRMVHFHRAPAYLALALLVLAAGALVGCTSASGPTPTPTGPSTITVTATTADGATVTSTVNLTISN